MFTAYKRYFDFEGRSSRSEYWLFVLLNVIVGVVYTAVVIGTRAADNGPSAVGLAAMAVVTLFGLASFIPSLSVTVRRLHDTDKSGWLILLGLIPLIGVIILLVFYILPGTKGPNKFGPDPYGKTQVEVFS
jgi:uncharacterized membrane protein YhaH (DUF805 family)